MAKTAKRLAGPGLLTNAAATKYTVPASTKTIIRQIHVANVTNAAAALTASIGADAAGTEIATGKNVPANDYIDLYGYWVMDAAEILQAFSSVNNALNLTLFGDELTLG